MNNRISAIFFSPTNTTKKIVTTIAKEFGENYKEYDLTLQQKREQYKELTFDCDDLIVVGVPVYKGRIPDFLVDYFSTYKGNNTKAIFTVVYGNRDYDDALLEIKDLFEKRGFIGIAAAAFIGEHSFSDKIATDRPDANDLNIVTQFAIRIKAQLNNTVDFRKHSLTVKGEYPYKESPQGQIMLPETNDRCTDCGICANTCPTGAIDYTNFRDIDPDKCIKCCNCVKICPENAKAFNAIPFIELTELLFNELAVGRKEPELFYSQHDK